MYSKRCNEVIGEIEIEPNETATGKRPIETRIKSYLYI
jgi:hypothetical protein